MLVNLRQNCSTNILTLVSKTTHQIFLKIIFISIKKMSSSDSDEDPNEEIIDKLVACMNEKGYVYLRQPDIQILYHYIDSDTRYIDDIKIFISKHTGKKNVREICSKNETNSRLCKESLSDVWSDRIWEKIKYRIGIEDLKKLNKELEPEDQLNLFTLYLSDFEKLIPDLIYSEDRDIINSTLDCIFDLEEINIEITPKIFETIYRIIKIGKIDKANTSAISSKTGYSFRLIETFERDYKNLISKYKDIVVQINKEAIPLPRARIAGRGRGRIKK